MQCLLCYELKKYKIIIQVFFWERFCVYSKFLKKTTLIWVAIFLFSLGAQANDADQDGYQDYFEIEILSQGVVPEEWDLGLVGSTSKDLPV